MTFLTTPGRTKQLFNLEALRDEAKARLTGRQWETRRALVDRCEKARQTEEKLLSERGDVRVAIARKKLIDEAGSKVKEHKPVTELGVKNIMREEFGKSHDGKDLYEWGKELDKQIFQPQVIEAQQAREAEKTQSQNYRRSYAPSR